MKNTFWYRHFLMCNDLAMRMCSVRGWEVKNFAACIWEEKVRFANQQMTVYFWEADRFLSNLHSSDEGQVFENLEHEGITFEELANLSDEQLARDFEDFCCGRIDFVNVLKQDE